MRGPLAPLPVQSAATIAKFKDGGAAITAATFGKGRAIAYGFFPGWQYWVSPDRTDWSRLPLGWNTSARRLAVAPAQVAKTPRPVLVNVEGVEACLLESPTGTAIVLLNWTDEPIPNFEVTLPGSKAQKVSSSEGAAVKTVASGNALKMSLPLKSVDVLMIE